MKLTILSVTIWLILSWPQLSYSNALSEPIVFSESEQITIAQGLPSNTVFSLQQDELGFIWVGTPSGLGLLDGYSAQTFSHPALPELSMMSPGNIYLDKQDELWVGTWGKGIKVINHNRTLLKDFSWIGDALASERIQSIFQASDDSIWVGTFDSGLFRIIPETQTLQAWQHQAGQPGLNHNRIWSLSQDNEGNIWIATSNGLIKLNPQDQSFESYFNASDMSVADKLIRTLLIKDNSLWFGTNLGLFKMDLNTKKIEKMMPPGRDIISVNRIVAHNDSGLWIGTFSGIFYYSLQAEAFFSFEDGQYSYLAQKDIRDIWVTPRDVLLLATRYSGIYKLNLRPKPVQQIQNQHYLDQNKLQIWEMARDDEGKVWAGTNDGIIRFDLNSKSTLSLPPVLENTINGLTLSVAISQNKQWLWIGTVNRLFRYDLISGELISFNERLGINQLNHIRLFVDSKDNLWVNSAHQGVLMVAPDGTATHFHTGAPLPYKLPDNNIAQLAEATDGALWLITGNSELLYKRPQDDFFTRLPLRFSAGDENANYIATSLHSHRDNFIYVGTYSGLLKINRNSGVTQRLTISDGLANDEIRAITSDWPGNLWVSTGTGITRISADGTEMRSFGRIDGLSSPSMNLRSILNCTESMMCFGSSNGINYIEENLQWQGDHNENIVISNLWINQEKQDYPATGDNYLNLILQSDERNIKFQFGKIDHRPAATHELYFRLEGFDDKWYASDVSRIANYTNLLPGSYVFEVTDSPTHYQKHSSAKIIVEIIPPFWSRLWVQVASVLGLLTLLTIGYRTRINQIRRNEQKLNKLVEARTRNMALLGDIGMEITRSLNFQEIFYNLQKHLKSILTEHDFMLGLLNEEKNALKFDLVISNFESLSRHAISLSEHPNICVQCFKDNKELVINSAKDRVKALENGLNLSPMLDYQSCACLPLQINGIATGVIFVRSRHENAYGEYERQFLRTIAAYTAVALKNARFYQEQKQTHEKRITWLENITHYLNHEMKNSMLGAQTSLNMLNRKIKDVELHKYVDRAEKSHKEMRSIMKAVSETTSLEASIMQTTSIEFEVSQVVSERLEDYEAIYPQASVVGHITPFVFIRGNDALITQCLDKLVNNAIEHCQADTDIEVRVELLDSNCVISVANIGDPLPEDVDDMFNLFTSSKTDARKGNFGMGLYVARLIAEFHHGQITAGPLVKGFLQGAKFELRIPIE
ncbi:two-component regulator propeller domain-containing protein [Planctobacterium marinum]|uniref:two-component regulator propeller domain-containing protein n=1 Tax=Planctobacterium marinum TaxID=1631968 RepID=UPI001E2B4381|nr:two-component regulator propeller domain-containing protein [Planctobacterium marinum]MCC2604992.1 GAF domain-containing protein [Planctobacterium marinum]